MSPEVLISWRYLRVLLLLLKGVQSLSISEDVPQARTPALASSVWTSDSPTNINFQRT